MSYNQHEVTKIVKDIQRLNGGIAALRKFIPRCADKCQHFFKLLKTVKKMIECSAICEKTFRELKKALIQLPTLQASKEGEVLATYVAFSDTTVSAVLVTERDQHKPIFFHSKAL